jgi:singapore isolate B (sub-type 7) whole genome shotgun sequence assembly, scaffold_6
LAFIIKELREWEENTGESVYLYNITMQFEGYSGEICSDDNYGREVDVTFPSFENSFWKV